MTANKAVTCTWCSVKFIGRESLVRAEAPILLLLRRRFKIDNTDGCRGCNIVQSDCTKIMPFSRVEVAFLCKAGRIAMYGNLQFQF